MPSDSNPQSQGSLFRHRSAIGALYMAAFLIAISVLRHPGVSKDLVSLLSAGAILATFGSAIATIGSIWERDLLERVRLNVDILFRDLAGESNPWRRWPFLPRSGTSRTLNGCVIEGILENPTIPLDVGTHVIEVQVPTVLEDFFDLSVRKNFGSLKRYRIAAMTTYSSKKLEAQDADNAGNAFGNQYMLYECLHDIWESILKFRVSRYVTHLGAALTTSGALVTSLLAVGSA